MGRRIRRSETGALALATALNWNIGLVYKEEKHQMEGEEALM